LTGCEILSRGRPAGSACRIDPRPSGRGGTLGARAEGIPRLPTAVPVRLWPILRICPPLAAPSYPSNSMVRKGSTVRAR